MSNTKHILTALAAGAGAMYLFDPSHGRRRRALLEDRLEHVRRTLSTFSGKLRRDFGNRLQSVPHTLRGACARRPGRRRGASLRGGNEWSPSARVGAGTAGVALLALALARRRGLDVVVGLAGGTLLARSLVNRPLGRLLGIAEARRAIDLDKTISVAAPVDEVYRIWSRPENFPLFMSHVDRIEPLGGDRYRWIVRAPGGTHVSWEARIVEQVENRRLSWESADGSTVGNEGMVRFSPVGPKRTRVQVRMSYNPPGGIFGHAVARAFGDDPLSAMHEDLQRFKSLLENGRTTAHGRIVHADELRH